MSTFVRIQGKKFSYKTSNHTSLCENSSTLQKISNRETHCNKEYSTLFVGNIHVNTLRTGSFKLFKRPFPGFLTILTLETLN